MADRGSSRAVSARADQGVGDDEIDFETPVDETGVQGDSEEGTDETEGADIDSGEEQEAGLEEDLELDPERVERVAGRATTRIQQLVRDNAEYKRQNADLNRRLQNLESRAPQGGQPPLVSGPLSPLETDEQFNARLQLMPPDERVEARLARSELKAEHRAQALHNQTVMQSDQATWNASLPTSDRRRRWATRVEEKHQEFMRNGQWVPRVAVYRYLLGEYMDSDAGEKQGKRRTEQGRRRVEAQTVRPASPRGDVDRSTRGRQTEQQARARRLENVQL